MKKHEETWTFKKKQKKNIKQWNILFGIKKFKDFI